MGEPTLSITDYGSEMEFQRKCLLTIEETLELMETVKSWFFCYAVSKGIPPQIAEELFQDVGLFMLRHERLERAGAKKFIKEKLIYAIQDHFRNNDPLGRAGRSLHDTVMAGMTRNGGDLLQALQERETTLDRWYKLMLRSVERGDPVVIDSTETVEEASARGAVTELKAPDQVVSNVERGFEQGEEQGFFEAFFTQLFTELPLREAMILFFYSAYDEVTLKRIGHVLDVTESRVSQIYGAVRSFLKRFKKRNDVGDIEYPHYAAELQFREVIKRTLLRRCQSLADRQLFNGLIQLLDGDEVNARCFDLLAEIDRVGGVQQVSEELLNALGYERVRVAKGSSRRSAVYSIRRVAS